MITKKFISCLLMILIITTQFVVLASDECTLVVTNSISDNGTFLSTVSIVNNPGIATFVLKLAFDNTSVTPVSITKGNAIPNGDENTGLTDIESNLKDPNADLNNLEFVTAVFASVSNITTNGELFTIEFKLKGDAKESIPLQLSYETGNIANEGLNNVNPKIQNANIEFDIKNDDIKAVVKKDTVFEDGKIKGDITLLVAPSDNKVKKSRVAIAVYTNDGYLAKIIVRALEIKTDGAGLSLKDLDIPFDSSKNTAKLLIWDANTIKPFIKGGINLS